MPADYHINCNFNSNPPRDWKYGNRKESKRKKGGQSGSGNKIWHKFIEKSFECITENGFISLITPCHWRLGLSKSVRKAQKLMWDSNIISVFPVNSFFDVGGIVKIDAWLISLNKNIKGMDINPFYRKKYFLPYNQSSSMIKFLKDSEDEDVFKINVHDNRHYMFNAIRKSEKGDKDRPYPHINTMPQLERKLFDWYDKKTDNFNDKKVIISVVAHKNRNCFFDKEGKYGTGHQSVAYLVNNDKEGEQLENFINNSKIVKEFDNEAGSGFAFNFSFITKIPKSWVKDFNIGKDL